jgi:hypothetical protein
MKSVIIILALYILNDVLSVKIFLEVVGADSIFKTCAE